MAKKTPGLRNRVAGQNWEREGVTAFRPFYPHVSTSRLVSRIRDNEKVDLAHDDELKWGRFPYNLQYKNYSTSLPYPKLLAELPEIDGIINVIMHKQTRKVGTRFMPVGKYAILNADDFMRLVAYRKGYEVLKRVVDHLPFGTETTDSLSKELKLFGL
jgi:hypothetical protein